MPLPVLILVGCRHSAFDREGGICGDCLNFHNRGARMRQEGRKSGSANGAGKGEIGLGGQIWGVWGILAQKEGGLPIWKAPYMLLQS